MKPTSKCPYFDSEEDMQDYCDHDIKHGCKYCKADLENGEWFCNIDAADGTEKMEKPETW